MTTNPDQLFDTADLEPTKPKNSGVYPAGVEVQRGARISEDGVYRYSLFRRWGTGEQLTFVMLNPSTADAHDDDPTIRKCVGFATRAGYDAINIVNLYAFRTTYPAELRAAHYLTGGQRNDDLLTEIGRHAEHGMPVVAAWGVHARADRVNWFRNLRGMDKVVALNVTKDDHPRHPLMLGYEEAKFSPWPTRSDDHHPARPA